MEEKRSKKSLILVGIIVLLMIAVGVYFLITKVFNKEDAPKEPEKPVVEKEKITPLMYEITKEGSTNKIYLIGSIHFAQISKIEFPKYVIDAYTNSPYLACEFNILKFLREVDQTELTKDYYYTEPDSLDKHVSKETYDKIVKYFKDNLNIGEEQVKKYSLAFIEDYLTQTILGKTEIGNSEGVDQYFLEKAEKDGKTILEVESYELQAEMEKNFPDKYYEITIREFLNDPDKSVQELKELYAAWCGGDEKEIEKVAIEEADESKYTAEEIEIFKKVDKAMLDDRNIGMVNKFKEYFNDNKKVLYMVGAAHLVGENGIANLLKQDGYTVKIVK